MRMTGALLTVCLAASLLGISGCAPSSQWDPQSAEPIKQLSVDLLRNLDSGDYMAMIAGADSNLVIMDFDENNVPFRADGIGEARAFMARLADVAKSQDVKFTSTITRNDAWATPTMGYSIVEYEQTISAGGQTMGPFKFRGTLVARREGRSWIMTHWHGSFSEMPPPMPMPEGAPAGAAQQ